MMSKYQVVYIKLEAAVKNWMRLADSKMRKQRLKKAFDIMRSRNEIYK